MTYLGAVGALSAEDSPRWAELEGRWAAGETGPNCPRLLQNLQAECLLGHNDFKQLLEEILRCCSSRTTEEVPIGPALDNAQKKLARSPMGPVIGGGRPGRLGRAIVLRKLAEQLSKASEGRWNVDDAETKLELFVIDPSSTTSLIPDLLPDTKLAGGPCMFVSFRSDLRNETVFDPNVFVTARDAENLLGLAQADPYVPGRSFHARAMVEWLDTRDHALHKPTVADAGDFVRFKPSADVNQPFGLTDPWGGQSGYPEAVTPTHGCRPVALRILR